MNASGAKRLLSADSAGNDSGSMLRFYQSVKRRGLFRVCSGGQVGLVGYCHRVCVCG